MVTSAITTITKEQLRNRWDTLSDALREAIASETNSQMVWKAAVGEHLSDDKAAVVSRLTGYVLLGFIHPEELAAEIKNEIGIDTRVAAAIAEPLNKKIFQPLREDLEQVYAPASKLAEGTPGVQPKPAMMEDIAPQLATSAIAEEAITAAIPIPAPQNGGGQRIGSASAEQSAPIPPAPAAEIPKADSAPSTSSGQTNSPQAPPVPRPASPQRSSGQAAQAAETPKPETPKRGTLPPSAYTKKKQDLSSLNVFGQFKKPVQKAPAAPTATVGSEQLTAAPAKPETQAVVRPKQEEAAPVSPATNKIEGSRVETPASFTPSKVEEDKIEEPFMLHQESEFQPTMPLAQPGFKISLSEEQFGKMEQKWTASPKPAQIETDSINSFDSARDKSPRAGEQRVVHYSDMRTPLAPETKKAEQPLVPPLPSPPLPGASGTPPAKPEDKIKNGNGVNPFGT